MLNPDVPMQHPGRDSCVLLFEQCFCTLQRCIFSCFSRYNLLTFVEEIPGKRGHFRAVLLRCIFADHPRKRYASSANGILAAGISL